MENNTTGNGSIAIGRQALNQNSTGGYNVAIGFNAGSNETGSNKLYIENSNSTTPLIYGEFDNDLLRINGTLDINNAYQFPMADGTANQVLQTDGAGSISWASPTTGAEKIDDLTDGRSDNDGTNDGSSIFLGIDAGLNDDLTDNRNIGIGRNSLTNNTSGNGNIAIGVGNLSNNSTGINNIAIGQYVLPQNNGDNNVAVGPNALYCVF